MAGDALEQRLVELETRLAFQEQALQELSDALAETRLEAARTAELLRNAVQELKLARGGLAADPASEPPPPHY
ncbi:SlyX family protein [Cognatiluteimonas lumbrici]|uniref:SlyX family protein n=1 Tax=Cognatiluteimonas lumbrici TaxID=2559601 RepID=UPI0011296817|nr:SlyX family protein [Luteimonas lumbrici]